MTKGVLIWKGLALKCWKLGCITRFVDLLAWYPYWSIQKGVKWSEMPSNAFSNVFEWDFQIFPFVCFLFFFRGRNDQERDLALRGLPDKQNLLRTLLTTTKKNKSARIYWLHLAFYIWFEWVSWCSYILSSISMSSSFRGFIIKCVFVCDLWRIFCRYLLSGVINNLWQNLKVVKVND